MAETAVAAPITSAYLKVLKRNLWVLMRDVEDFTQEQSLVRVVDGGSNTNWLIGHLIHSRCGILRSIGAEAPWGPEMGERYGNGSTAPSAEDAESFEELIATFKATQPLLEEALAGATEADLDRDIGDAKVGDRIEFLVWHESYHCGQTVLYRRGVGLVKVTP